jgi:1,4-alpha-glucan branching enzyme
MAKGKQTKAVKPVREKVFISEADQYLFGQGTHYDIYKKLGAHISVENKQEGIYFAVWAPNAKEVHVVGDFNEWNPTTHIMKKCGPIGIYELFVPGLGEGVKYKYLITTPSGEKLYKA